MSNTGKFTSLTLNVLNGLMNNKGFRINPLSIQNYGLWTTNSEIQGGVVNETVLNKITYARSLSLSTIASNKLSMANWRKLLDIGKNICPALSNTYSDLFIPKYPGYGSWGNKNVDEFGNIISDGSELSLTESVYPPKNYGKEKTYSYIYKKHGDYAWVAGWPGRYSWQEKNDDFLAITKPDSNVDTITDYDRYFSSGFLINLAKQAYYEFWSNYESRRPNQYKEFVKFIEFVYQWNKNSNFKISSFVNTKTFLKGTYSNINDLTTSDIAGVNLAFRKFGEELINLGKSLDLSNIHLFGLPSKFLLNLQKNNALTDSMKYALLLSEFDTIELEQVLSDTFTPDSTQEKKIYSALELIKGNDLDEIKIILNCATVNLNSLADLINPLKMFPVSYASLTIPEYRTDTLTFKNYDLIYNGDSINPLIQNWGDYLENILSEDLAKACGAFMMSMNQIKNIRQMELEKLAQVIINLESTNKDLPLVNSTYATPGDVPSANDALQRTSFGSGNNNTYKFIDFLGAMSGIPYNDILLKIKTKIKSLPTSDLEIIYKKIYQKSTGIDWELLGTDAKLYTNTISAGEGDTEIITTENINGVLSVGDRIIFNKEDVLSDLSNTIEYEVIDVTTNLVYLNKPLMTGLEAGTHIFKFNDEYDNSMIALINQSNNIINTLKSKYPSIILQINQLWDRINAQLSTEQLAITLAIKQSSSIYQVTDDADFESFVRNIDNYAKDTEYGEISHVLESIADISNIYGQSLVAALRESRNSARIINTGGELDNDIPDTLPANTASANVVVVDGKIVDVIITSPGYKYVTPPTLLVEPQGGVFGGNGQGGVLQAELDDVGSISDIIIVDPGFGYDDSNPPNVIIDSPPGPTRIGGPLVLGSFSGSPYTDQDPVPDELVPDDDSSFDVSQAIDEIIRCKCSC